MPKKFMPLLIGPVCFLTACTTPEVQPDASPKSAPLIQQPNSDAKSLAEAQEVVRRAADSDLSTALNGIKVLNVSVDLRENFAKVPITSSELLEPLTLKIRLAGLKVNSVQEQLMTQGPVPYLIQNIRTWTSDNGDTIYSVDTRLDEKVVLWRNMTLAGFVPIWHTDDPELNGTAKNEVHDAIVKASAKQADEFVNEFLKQKQ